jgi:SAM-dependent methyltransferase
MEPDEQRDFWERHIGSWSASAYQKKQGLPFIERIATPFRQHLRARRDLGVEIVAKSKAARVLELGCGTGEFAVALMQASPALKGYMGVDISEAAIADARAHLQASGGSRIKTEVRAAAVEDLDPARLNEFDMVVGLGLLPYVTDSGFEKLSSICRGKKFLFDYHPREASLTNVLHFLYRKASGYPFYREFTADQAREIFSRFEFGQFEIERHGILCFVQRL